MINNGMIEKLRRALKVRQRIIIPDSKLKPSAVLLPVFQKDGRCHIVFTKRTANLSHHKGQVSFPGGGCDDTDKSLVETALRECHEEIGLLGADVEIIGGLDDAATVTSRYRITPFVGLIPHPYHFKPDPSEVDEIFDVPIEALLDTKPVEELVTYGDRSVRVLTYNTNGHVIWGATAGILSQFLDICAACMSEARCKS